MELVAANAIEFLGGDPKMIVRKNYHIGSVFLTRTDAAECDSLEAHIGRDGVLIFWMNCREYSYNGRYIVHWA